MAKDRMTDHEKAGRTGTVSEDMDRENDESPLQDGDHEESADQKMPQRDRTPRPARPTGSGLRIYKPTQGYYVRVGTAIGAFILIIAGGAFLFGQFGGMVDPSKDYALPLQYGVSVGFILLTSILVYWVVGLNRKTNDFFIATEGEMKKVSWSSRKEIVRSTKVVIVTVLLMATLLFVVDVGFMVFFRAIGVLKGGPGFLELFGGSKS